jgi:hypothetical protein
MIERVIGVTVTPRWLGAMGRIVVYGGAAVVVSGSIGYSYGYQDGLEAIAPWYVIPSCRARTSALANEETSPNHNENAGAG